MKEIVFRCAGAVAMLCAIAACNSSSTSSTPSGPNASSTTVTVEDKNGSRLGQIPVTLSTGIGTNGLPSGIISSDPTNSIGQVTFSSLPSSGQLCVSAETEGSGKVFRTHYCTTPFPSSYTLKFSSDRP
jgi:hypothetical protein